MNAIPLVRSSSLRPLIEFVERGGAAFQPLRDRLPLPDADLLVPVAHAGALFEEAARRSGVAALGFRLAEATPAGGFGEWRSLTARAPTAAAFLERAIATHQRFNSGYRLWLVARGDEAWLQLRYLRALRDGRAQVVDFALRMVLALLREVLGPAWRPLDLHLEGEPPPHAEELAALATRAVYFRQPGLALVFPRHCLAQRHPPDPLAPALRTGVEAPAADFAGSARQLVRSLLQLGVTELAAAAEAAGMSERSFQRRLRDVGLRYSELVEAARFESALRLLADPARRVIDVSTALGYSDSANFTRAFRRWSGVSPQRFRTAGI